MGSHLIDGKFQSDKYPTTPRGCVPLKCSDKTAQDLLFEYAQRRRALDVEFSADLEAALKNQGYEPAVPSREACPSVCVTCFRRLRCEEKSVARSHAGPWRCAVCEMLLPPHAHAHVVGGSDVARFAAAVMPLAMRMTAYLLSLEHESYDEPGLPHYIEWNEIVEILHARLGLGRDPG